MAATLRITISACIAVITLMGSTAHAVTVTNRDDREHKITIVEGEAKTDHVLKPQAVLANLCAKGCILRLNDSDEEEYELETNDSVSIEDGYLYYEDADPPGGPPAPGTKEPSK